MTTTPEAPDQAPATAEERRIDVYRDGRYIAHAYLTGSLEDAAQTIVDQIVQRYCTCVGRSGWVVLPHHIVFFSADIYVDGLFQIAEHPYGWLPEEEFYQQTGTSLPKECLQ